MGLSTAGDRHVGLDSRPKRLDASTPPSMTFPRSKSRTLAVGQHKYRWVVSRPDRQFVQRLRVEYATAAGQQLVCAFENRLHSDVAPITPHRVRALIERALRRGWRPTIQGPPFELDPCPAPEPTHAGFPDAWFTEPEDLTTPLSLESWTSLDPIRRGFPWNHYSNTFGRFRIWGGCSDIQIGTIFADLVGDQEARPGSSREEALESLLRIENVDAPGEPTFYIRAGRVLKRGNTLLMEHGCCTSLDEWVEWRALVDGGESPWNGHDPMSTAVREGDRVVFEGQRRIEVTLAEYVRLLNGLEQDTRDFALRVEQWLLHHCRKAALCDQLMIILRRTLSLPPTG